MTYSICIVGAGPAGLTLARELAKLEGVDVHVLEKGDDHSKVPDYNPNRSCESRSRWRCLTQAF